MSIPYYKLDICASIWQEIPTVRRETLEEEKFGESRKNITVGKIKLGELLEKHMPYLIN